MPRSWSGIVHSKHPHFALSSMRTTVIFSLVVSLTILVYRCSIELEQIMHRYNKEKGYVERGGEGQPLDDER